MFSLWQDRQRWPPLCCSRWLSLINSALWLLTHSCSCIKQAIPVVICAVSQVWHPPLFSSSFIFSALSAHFSTLCVYGIEIIESYASLPLHAAYVCTPSPLSFHPPLPCLLERVHYHWTAICSGQRQLCSVDSGATIILCFASFS